MKSKTENMIIDVDSIPEGENAVYEIEFLSNINSWVNVETDLIPKDKLVRYLVVLYSYDSFLNQRNPLPLSERKQRALSFAGIEPSNDVTDQLLLLENDGVLLMVQDFLVAQNHNLWTEIATTEQQYEEAIRLRLQPIKTGATDKVQLDAATKKKALRLDCKEMQGDIDVFYKKFYKGHDDVKDKVRRRASSLELLSKSAKHV